MENNIEGIKRLMVAIVGRAVDDLISNNPTNRDYLSARAYIDDDRETDYVFSFRNICETLNFDPDYIRRGIYDSLEERTLTLIDNSES